MKTTKRLLAVLLALVLLCVGVPFAAHAEEGLAPTGSCGDNVTWSFEADTGALMISGTGTMFHYSYYYENSPFYKKTEIKSVTIKNGVTSIGDYAFYGCSSLKSVTIPASVTSIGWDAFSGCSSLTNVTIPDSVASIGDSAFFDCSSLTSVTIPDSVTEIGNSVFYGCSSLKSVTIPASVTSIGWDAFSGCSSLTNVTIPDSVTSIRSKAFYSCVSLAKFVVVSSNQYYSVKNDILFNKDQSIVICCPPNKSGSILLPGTVTSIDDYAFSHCSILTSVTIPDSMTSIGKYAFEYCRRLTSMTIPSSVTSIGVNAFYNCSSLRRVNITDLDAWCKISKSLPFYTGYSLFLNGTILDDMEIPDSVTSISDYAFYKCSSLTSVTIPNSVSSIGSFAFDGCSNLTNVMILDGVTSIGDRAFDACKKLKDVYFTGSEEAWNAISIGSYNTPLTNATIHYNYPHKHTKGEPVRKNEHPATCITASSYELVTYCTLCGEELSRETVYEGDRDSNAHDPQIGKVVEPTCTDPGYTPFICTRCGETVSKTDPTDALGHNPKPVYTWAKDDSTVTATMVCTRCDKTGMTETTEVKTEITVKPTCSTEGELTLIAAFNNKSFYGQTKTRTLPRDPDAHVFKVTVTPPTCVDDGYTTHACTLCRYGYSDEIVSALGHDYQHHDAKAPTCEAPGWDAYDTCSRCDYTTYSELATVDHDDADNDGKCDMCGEQMRGGSHCKYCGKVHNGNFFDKLTGFFHRILAIFKR